jgi:hypothetical protein
MAEASMNSRVKLCDGKLYVDKTTQVPVTERLDA